MAKKTGTQFPPTHPSNMAKNKLDVKTASKPK